VEIENKIDSRSDRYSLEQYPQTWKNPEKIRNNDECRVASGDYTLLGLYTTQKSTRMLRLVGCVTRVEP